METSQYLPQPEGTVFYRSSERKSRFVSITRLLNADPLQFGGGNNWFAFANGNPASRYGQRAARHELTHLGAALRGQTDTFLHEVAVQAATTPEQLWLMGGMLGGGIGKGIHRALK